MAGKKKEEAISSEEQQIPTRKSLPKKEFSLDDFKKTSKKNNPYKNKPDKWIPVSKAFQDITSLPGLNASTCHYAFGYHSTGKSTLLLESAISAQKMGILPVFLITEQKHRWGHAKEMGLDITENVDEETGNITYDGFFLFYDRNDFNSIESLGKIINDLIDKQEAGKLPYDLLFLIDSFGKLNCEKGIKNNNQFQRQWIASSISEIFGAGIIPRINMSISDKYEHTNTLLAILQPWTELPEVYGALPLLTPKGGKSFPQDCAIGFKFGGDTNSKTSKLKIKKNGQELVWGIRTRVEVEKNHITNVTTRGKMIITKDGFISVEDEKEYIKKNIDYFLKELNSTDDSDVEFLEEDGDDD